MRGRGEDREQEVQWGVGARKAIGFGPRALGEETTELKRVGHHYSGMEGEQVGDVWVQLYRRPAMMIVTLGIRVHNPPPSHQMYWCW